MVRFQACRPEHATPTIVLAVQPGCIGIFNFLRQAALLRWWVKESSGARSRSPRLPVCNVFRVLLAGAPAQMLAESQ